MHKRISFNKLFKLVFAMAVVLQLVVITYNHFSGYQELSGFNELINRALRGIFFSMTAGFAIAYPDLWVIQTLNNRLPWQEKAVKRIFIQFALMLVIAITVSSLQSLFVHWVYGYEQGLANVLFNNILIYSVVNAFFMSVLEGWIYLTESIEGKEKAEKLQRELMEEAAHRATVEAQIQIEAEKNKYAQKLIEQEKELNHHLAQEIKKREVITGELDKSREQLDSILTNLAGAAYRCRYNNETCAINYISEKIFDITGYHASEFTGNSELLINNIIHPDDRDYYLNKIREAASGRTHYEFEIRMIHKNGNIVWINETGKGICNSKGEMEYLDGLIIDITRRKEAELAAEESELKYKELMDFLPQPIFELDTSGYIMLLNKAGEQFFGIDITDDSGPRPSALDYMIKEDVPRVVENIKKTNQNILTPPNEYTVKRPDGSLCPVLIYGTPIIRNNKVKGRRGIIIDISDIKAQEAKLIKAKEELERINNTLEQSVARRTKQLTEANTQLLKVQKEHLQSQFEVLKQQVNPHFLFNSLNVLTSLIKVDPDLAESFTERLSKVYRYVLENKEKDLVTLTTELEFLNSYLFLLEIRFMKKLFISIKVNKEYYEYLILPIAIQLVIENAIKHNTFSKVQPLKIEVFVDGDEKLNIINNLNERETKITSTGVGLENINRRYALVSNHKPEFIKTTDRFIAKLPLLRPDKSETE